MLKNPHYILALIALSTMPVWAQSTTPVDQLIDSLRRQPDLTTSSAWRALSARGIPYAAPVPSNLHQMLVTFAWRGDSGTRNAVLISPLALVDFHGSIMERLGSTDVWYKTLSLPADTRFVYRFARNDRLIPFEQDTDLAGRFATMRRDSANPRVFDYGPFGEMSILELPGAPSDTSIRPRAGPHGTVTRVVRASPLLGQDRGVSIYTPAGFQATGGTLYPLLVFSDGESYQSLIPTPTILDNLIASGAIPPIVAVFVDNAASVREHELNCSPQWGAYLATEIVPWLRSRYHITTDARRVAVVGYSLGGLAAACAAIEHPDVFGAAIAQSGSFFRAPPGEPPEWLARHLAQTSRLPVHFVLSIGRFETAVIPSRDPSMLTASRHLRDVLLAKGYAVDYRELSSGHEHVAWRAVLADAICNAFAKLHDLPPR